MKILGQILILLLPWIIAGQFQSGDNINIRDTIGDDVYLAGDHLKVDAPVVGDLVAAGNELQIRDSIAYDVIAAGSDIWLSGTVGDDVRAAGGTIIIDSEVGDDLILFGGKVRITEEAIIRGNITVFAGQVDIEGDIEGEARISSGMIRMNGVIGGDARLKTGDLWIDGTIEGQSKIIADELKLGDQARFYGDVDYWSDDGEIDFGNSLINAKASFKEEMVDESEDYPLGFFGIATLGFWMFYVISVFLLLVLLNWALRRFFPQVAHQLNEDLLKSLGYGLIYIVGIPLVIGICFMIIVGIPLGLFLLFTYIFSLLFGHLIVALLTTYYLNNRNERSWNFWTISILALAIAMILRIMTMIPILGFLISVFVIAVAYGAIYLTLSQPRKVV